MNIDNQNAPKFHPSERIVVVPGNFNVVHAGHIRIFEFARSLGDKLLVILFEDGDDIHVPVEDRFLALNAISMIDEVITVKHDNYIELIENLRPYSVVKGKEHESQKNIESEILSAWNGHLIFAVDKTVYSAKKLFDFEVGDKKLATLDHDYKFLNKKNVDLKKCIQIVEKFKDLKILVYGDLILDEYISCTPLGMSQEDPTIVVNPVDKKRFVGGAGIVAAHCRSLGAKVDFLTVVGHDEVAKYCEEILKNLDIGCKFIVDVSRPTTKKKRYKALDKTLLRVSNLAMHDIDDGLQQEVDSFFNEKLLNWDYVIFSDFNYGAIPEKLLKNLLEKLIANKIKFSADSQASSQDGDVSKFLNANLIAATEREARMSLRDSKSGIQYLSNKLIQKACADNVIIKLGAEGMLVNEAKEENNNFVTDSVLALNSQPIDVAGAGDAFLSAASLSMAAGSTIWEAAYIGSIASAIQVSQVGNQPINSRRIIEVMAKFE